MDKPKLSQDQFAVGQAEFNTGHVLNNDDSVFHTGDDINNAYTIFGSLTQAKEFGLDKVQNNPEIECYVYNLAGQTIFVCDKNGERKLT